VDTFYYEASQRQVPIAQLGRNAFVYGPARPALPGGGPAGQGDGAAASAYMGAVANLQLQSVLSGPHGNKAMISNNVLSEGQAIEGWTVKRIASQEVILAREEVEYVLRMAR